MQIVIDIPEDVYTRLFDNDIQDNEIAVDDVCEMARAIRLGTLLPKGHGRIGDLDQILIWLIYKYDTSRLGKGGIIDNLKCGEITPVFKGATIIEADTESEGQYEGSN